jgi:hypothetical protein
MSPPHTYWQPLSAVEIGGFDSLESAYVDPWEDTEEE